MKKMAAEETHHQTPIRQYSRRKPDTSEKDALVTPVIRPCNEDEH